MRRRRATVDQLLAAARATLRRLAPADAHAAMRDGAQLVDIRSGFVPPNVLEWRLYQGAGIATRSSRPGDTLLVLP